MREILFRGKRSDNGEWIEWDALTGMPHDVRIWGSTICQYTGLTDKNGNKIWENDIVQYRAVVAIVKFGEYGNGNLGFYVDYAEETNYRKDFAYWAKKTAVEGNLFDNPDLLQELPHE